MKSIKSRNATAELAEIISLAGKCNETLKYNLQYYRKLSLDRRNFLVYASVARGIATDQDLTSSIQQTKCS